MPSGFGTVVKSSKLSANQDNPDNYDNVFHSNVSRRGRCVITLTASPCAAHMVTNIQALRACLNNKFRYLIRAYVDWGARCGLRLSMRGEALEPRNIPVASTGSATFFHRNVSRRGRCALIILSFATSLSGDVAAKLTTSNLLSELSHNLAVTFLWVSFVKSLNIYISKNRIPTGRRLHGLNICMGLTESHYYCSL